MKKPPVFALSIWSACVRISSVTALLFTLGACGSSGGGDGTGSGSGGGSGGTGGGSGSGSGGSGNGSGSGGGGSTDDGGGTGSAPAIKFVAGDDGVNGTELCGKPMVAPRGLY